MSVVTLNELSVPFLLFFFFFFYTDLNKQTCKRHLASYSFCNKGGIRINIGTFDLTQCSSKVHKHLTLSYWDLKVFEIIILSFLFLKMLMT